MSTKRILKLAALFAGGRSTVVELSPFDARLRIWPRLSVGSSWAFLFRGQYETELLALRALLPTGGVFIDGGANVGIYTVAAASLVGPNGLVVAFEPAEETFALLRDNVRLNAAANVRLVQRALGERNERQTLFHHGNAPNSYSLGEGVGAAGREQVDVISLDSCEALRDVGRADVIKLDIEGAEELALRGGQELLTRYWPYVLLEISPGLPERLSLAPFGAWELLQGLGYSFARADRDDGLVAVGAPRGGNYVAVPPSSKLVQTDLKRPGSSRATAS